MPQDKQQRADELKKAQRNKRQNGAANGDRNRISIEPMPGAEPPKYHDRVKINPFDDRRTWIRLQKPGMRTTKA